MAKKRKIIDPELRQAKKELVPYYDPNKGISPNLDFLNEQPHQFNQVVVPPKKEDI